MKKRSVNHKNRAFLREFGRRVRKARLAKGWTLEDVEEHGWNSWQHLQQIETGKKNINLVTFAKLAKLLKVDLNQLLGDF